MKPNLIHLGGIMIALIALLHALSHPYQGLAREETDKRTPLPVSLCASEELVRTEVVQAEIAVIEKV
jgi:hypothetical protein